LEARTVSQLDRRMVLKGVAVVVAALPFQGAAVAAFEEFPRFLAPPPITAGQAHAADLIIRASRWHYESLDEGWGIIRQQQTGFVFASIPGSYPSAAGVDRDVYPFAGPRDVYPLLGADDTKAAAGSDERQTIAQAAAQVATWAEDLGGGTLYLSFPYVGGRACNASSMKTAPAPRLVAFDGSRSLDRDFLLFS